MARLKKKQIQSDELLPIVSCRIACDSLFQWTKKDHEDVWNIYHNCPTEKANNIPYQTLEDTLEDSLE